MRNEISFRDWLKNYEAGQYDENDRATQINAGWYDWFCRTESLVFKTQKMATIVKGITEGGKIDFDKNYVWFKNNCPMVGPLYDDFRFADKETGDVIFTVEIHNTPEEARYTVYGTINDFEKSIFKTNSVRELRKWFNTPW